MGRYEAGMLARSKAGHDRGKLYIIIGAAGAYVYLADGQGRTTDRAKKKNIRHIQIINRQYEVSSVSDDGIRRILREYEQEALYHSETSLAE